MAESCEEVPVQIVEFPEIEVRILGCTVTTTESFLTHPVEEVTFTKYFVVVKGKAIGLETVVDESPVFGDH